ncbi:MAG: hypothetical protein HFP77_03885 [Methylococcales symbiont of Iophon sp. n. MRB-2018]|nr:MAG: hypothetical protein HFP77_03885 [Methylococcales symbiont of Iophon sp. n. MRB-2018]
MPMPQLDIIKETIAYLKFWLGVMVVSDISLVGWLLSNAEKAPDFKIYGTTVGIVIITVSAVFVHKRIEHFISTLKDL